MSIWGEADAAATPDDPFRVYENWYPAFSTECYVQEKEGDYVLITKWKIQQPGNRFNGFPVRHRAQFYPFATEELDGDQIQRNSFMKMYIRQAFDLTEDQVNSFEPKMGLNKKAMIKVTNSPDKTNPEVIYTNVQTAVSMRLYEERYGSVPSDNGEVLTGASMLDQM